MPEGGLSFFVPCVEDIRESFRLVYFYLLWSKVASRLLLYYYHYHYYHYILVTECTSTGQPKPIAFRCQVTSPTG